MAAQIADRIAVLYAGELAEIGRRRGRRAPAAARLHPVLLASRLTLTTPRDERFASESDSAATESAVSIRALTKTFGVGRGRRRHEITAVDGVDLEIGSGEALAIVGESGSGKSTLLRMVAGLRSRPRGWWSWPATAAPQMVFQDAGSSLTPWLSVGETLGERLRPLRLSQREVRERVDRGAGRGRPAARVAKARPGELSGGQRQRVDWPARR